MIIILILNITIIIGLAIFVIIEYKQKQKLIKYIINEKEKNPPKIIRPSSDEEEKLRKTFEENKKQFLNMINYNYEVALGKGGDE